MNQGLPFSSYALSQQLLKTLNTLGYLNTTPVQAATLPRAMQGDSLIVRYQTGSGKTHAFLIPIFARLKPHAGLQTIVVSPTRELAMQTFLFAKAINDGLGNPFKMVVLQGGFDKQRDLFQTYHQNIAQSQQVNGHRMYRFARYL